MFVPKQITVRSVVGIEADVAKEREGIFSFFPIPTSNSLTQEKAETGLCRKIRECWLVGFVALYVGTFVNNNRRC